MANILEHIPSKTRLTQDMKYPLQILSVCIVFYSIGFDKRYIIHILNRCKRDQEMTKTLFKEFNHKANYMNVMFLSLMF